jgi:hypothetical protein
MAHFNLHFFKEKVRKIEVDSLFGFFDDIPGFDMESDDESVRFTYHNKNLNYQARFIITKKSMVPNIYRLNPKYLDVNFHLELPILLVDYAAKQVFEIARELSEQFNLFVYNELFEDVIPFKMAYVMKAFTDVKDIYIERNPLIISDYYMQPKNKLSDIYRYTDDSYDLQKYYHGLKTHVPYYFFLKDDNKYLKIEIEWLENTLTVFPPYLDYIIVKSDKETKIIDYIEFYEVCGKYLSDVPGFIKGSKVLQQKQAKKVYKVIRKHKFTKIPHTFKTVHMRYLLD